MIGAVLIFLLLLTFLRPPREIPKSKPQTGETVDQKSYDLGYTRGYQTAKEEDQAAYQRGYNAAREEISSGGYGLLGFFTGLFISLGSFAAIKRKELSEWFQELRKRYELKKAFKTIPSNLSPEIDAIAHQIALAYINILHQLRASKGHLVMQYAQQWRAKLRELMNKAVHLMELIQELEFARANIDEKELAKTVRSLKRTIQSPNTDDAARNAAAKSLQRAKQTQQDLQKTQKNLERCKTSLQGITGVLESMYLKISNLKVNTQQTELLDELSSDLESEMSALEEALSEFTDYH